jgi:hypothetical protein
MAWVRAASPAARARIAASMMGTKKQSGLPDPGKFPAGHSTAPQRIR